MSGGTAGFIHQGVHNHFDHALRMDAGAASIQGVHQSVPSKLNSIYAETRVYPPPPQKFSAKKAVPSGQWVTRLHTRAWDDFDHSKATMPEERLEHAAAPAKGNNKRR